MDNPASLQRLRDIAEPAPVPWWPPAVGWWILIVVAAAVVIWLALRARRRWRANAYRRAALERLRSATHPAEIAEILKRAALCAYPRTDVASLSGAAWSDWLRRTSDRELPVSVAVALEKGVFANTTEKSLADMASFAASWVRHHRRADR